GRQLEMNINIACGGTNRLVDNDEILFIDEDHGTTVRQAFVASILDHQNIISLAGLPKQMARRIHRVLPIKRQGLVYAGLPEPGAAFRIAAVNVTAGVGHKMATSC